MSSSPPITRFLSKVYAPVKAVVKPVLGRFPRVNRACIALKERVKEFSRARSVLPPLRDELRRWTGDDVSHLFLVRWIHRGGADLETLNYLEALASDPANRVTVIATFDAESVWADRVPKGVRFLEFGARMRDLSWRERQRLFADFLDELRPDVIHNINSELAYRVFCAHGKRLSRHSKLYASVFCTDLDPSGSRSGYGFYVAKCYEHLDGLFCDNQRHLDELVELFDLEPSKMHVHYQPAPAMTDLDVAGTRRGVEGPLHVLWAGRWDRQKRPDILAAVAAKCRDLPIRFHVYGQPVLDDDSFTTELADTDNVEIHGAFDGLASLPLADFDVLLLTSQWEGLPNILLEAIVVGLPIVTSRVGGIGELLQDRESALLVERFDDVEAYADHFAKLIRDRALLVQLAGVAKERLQRRHTWDQFRGELESLPAYSAPRRAN